MSDTYGPWAHPIVDWEEAEAKRMTYDDLCYVVRTNRIFVRAGDYQFTCLNEKCQTLKWRDNQARSNCFSCGRFGKLQYTTRNNY